MNWLKKLTDWLLPTYCVLCRHPTANTALCTPCNDTLPWLHHACIRCANPFGENMNAGICGQCLHTAPPYQRILTPFAYQSPIDHLILALKFSGKLAYARVLGELLAAEISKHYTLSSQPQLIIPVPLHRQRLRERGFNQALEIAQVLHKQLKIPLGTHLCRRHIATQPQSGLSADERSRNVKQAFSIHLDIKASHVAIVDDVVTTSNTVAELTRTLLSAGVQRVDVWCCARTGGFS